MAMVAMHDDMFTADVMANPYTYYGRLREEDPVHWNELYDLWVITRHDDVVWMTRHHELFSNAVFRNDPRPAYPAISLSRTGSCTNTSELPGGPVYPARPPRASRGVMSAISRPGRWKPGAPLCRTPDRTRCGEARARDVMKDRPPRCRCW